MIRRIEEIDVGVLARRQDVIDDISHRPAVDT